MPTIASSSQARSAGAGARRRMRLAAVGALARRWPRGRPEEAPAVVAALIVAISQLTGWLIALAVRMLFGIMQLIARTLGWLATRLSGGRLRPQRAALVGWLLVIALIAGTLGGFGVTHRALAAAFLGRIWPTGQSGHAVSGNPAPAINHRPSPVRQLHIVGNHLYDSNGDRVTLRGASRWSLEFSCTGDSHFTVQDFQNMQRWGFNVVRFPMNSSYWLYRDNNGCSAQDYQATLANAVRNAEHVGLYVMLVGQWSAQRGNSPMAYPQDRTFFTQLAQAYQHDDNVGFVPVTEPHDVSWDEWYNGWNGGPGMRELVDIINTDAPNHLIFVNGLNWGNDVSFLTNHYAITGPNIAYEVHIFQYWNPARFAGLIANYVILGGEFGINDCCHDYVDQVMAYFEAAHTGYMAWAWADGQSVLLLQNVIDPNSPTPLGQRVKRFCLAHLGQ